MMLEQQFCKIELKSKHQRITKHVATNTKPPKQPLKLMALISQSQGTASQMILKAGFFFFFLLPTRKTHHFKGKRLLRVKR